MIARLTVQRGPTTEYPLAEKTKGGWQNGVTFYPDTDVTHVVPLAVSPAPTGDARGRDVAVIIGADDIQADVDDLDTEGREWAIKRFGGEARYLVKAFDYLAAAREAHRS